MGGILEILNISAGALLNQQLALEVTSHNIANASNPNYSRQRVVQTTRFPMYTQYGAVGRGTRIANIEQIRDVFVDRLVLERNSTYNYFVGQDGIMNKVESLLNETGDYGLSTDLQAFWNSWQDLARNPEGTAERQAIIEKASSLADKIRNIYNGLQEVKEGTEQKIGDGVTQVNTILEKIADLNKDIVRVEVTGHPANDLRDQRQQALEELSEYVDFDYNEDSTGAITVEFYTDHSSNAKVTMVSGGEFGYLDTPVPGVSPAFTGQDASGTNVANFDFQGGKLVGWKEMWDKVDGYESSLNDFAGTLIDAVNTYQHDGATNFFAGTDASTIEYNAAFQLDQIVAGSTAADNSIAIIMAGLGDTPQGGLGGESLNDYWQNFVSGVGTEAHAIETKMDFQKALKEEFKTEQQSISGVSIEQEMINMIQYQHIYQAAARMITTGKEMLDTLVHMT